MSPEVKSKYVATNAYTECRFRDVRIGELEAKLDVSHGYLSRCRKGTKIMSSELMNKIAKVLDMRIEDLLTDPNNYECDCYIMFGSGHY